jgi:hypothetical protein
VDGDKNRASEEDQIDQKLKELRVSFREAQKLFAGPVGFAIGDDVIAKKALLRLIEESIAERLSVGLRGEVSPDDARRVRDEFRSLF